MIKIEGSGNYKHPENNEDNMQTEVGGVAAFIILIGLIIYSILTF
jgi:hypothetical protein